MSLLSHSQNKNKNKKIHTQKNTFFFFFSLRKKKKNTLQNQKYMLVIPLYSHAVIISFQKCFFQRFTNILGWFSYTWGLFSIKMKIPQSSTFYWVLQKTVRAEERNGFIVLASPVIVVCTSHSQQSTSFYEMNNNVGNKRIAHVVVP